MALGFRVRVRVRVRVSVSFSVRVRIRVRVTMATVRAMIAGTSVGIVIGYPGQG